MSINANKDADGHYKITKGSTYEINLSFAEDTDGTQFDNPITYTLPAGFNDVDQSFNTFAINVSEGSGTYTVYGNTVSLNNGKLTVRFNESDPNWSHLQQARNTTFNLKLKGTFDDSAKDLDWGNGQKTSLNVDTNGSLTTTKTANYDPSDGKVHYTVTVHSSGYNTNINVADSLTGTALTYDKNVQADSSSGSAKSQNDRGFTYTIPEMTDGQTVTLTYTASVNFDALGGGTGTAEQVGNSVKTTSDQQKTSQDVQTNWNNKINYLSISKSAGSAIDGNSGNKTIPWTVTYNANPKGSAAGRTITDSIADDSKDILKYTGDGIKIDVKDVSGNPVRTDNVAWSKIKESDASASWSYTIPETDKGHAYSYTVTYTTDTDTSGIVTDKTVHNTVHDDKDHTTGASQNIQPGPDNKIAVTKTAGAADNQKISWTVTLTVPKAGLKTAQVTDTLPTQYVDGQQRYDSWDDDSVKVEGLLDGETMVKDQKDSDQAKAVYTFYQDKDHTKTGLKSSDSARTITVTFDTKINQDWLDKADQTYMMKHTNQVDFKGNGQSVTASADKEVVKQEIKKSVSNDSPKNVTIDGKTYPAWYYTITLKGAEAQDFDVTDKFDSRLSYVNPNDSKYQNCGLDLGSVGKLSDQWNNIPWNATRLSADTTTDGQVVFHIKKSDVESIENNKELHISYWLIAKNPTALMKDAAAAQDGKTTLNNKATWAGDSANANADYKYPGLSKKLLTDKSNLNTTDGSQPVATYELDANPAGAQIGDGDTVAVKDTMSDNQILNPQSVQMTPSEGTSFKVEKGDDGQQVITFTIPNKTAVKIVYSATVTGNGGNLKNSAEMAGYKASSENSASKQTSSGGSAANYSLTVFKHKEGDLTTKLAGCTFELHKADETADQTFKGRGQTFTTGQDGTVEIKQPDGADWGLKAGVKYYLIETKAPAGYQLDSSPHYFTISADGSQDTSKHIYMNGGTLNVADKPTSTTSDKGSLEIVKNTSGGTTPADTLFTITGSNYSKTVKYSEFTDGKLTLGDLIPGDYTVKEDTGSAQVKSYTLTVKSNNSVTKVEANKTATDTITNTYNQDKGKLEIVKTTTGGTTPADTVFTITGPNQFSKTVKYSDFKDGKLTIDNLPVGEYTVTENVETAKVGSYTLTVSGDNGKQEAVTKDETAKVNITNTYSQDKGSLEIVKTTSGGTTPADTVFTITGPNNYSKTVKYSEFTNGKYELDKLPIGEYTVKEDADSAKVNNYTLTVKGNNSVTKVEANQTATDTIANTYTPNEAPKSFSLKVRKTDSQNTAKRIGGSRYAIYQWTGQTDSGIAFNALTRKDVTEGKDWMKIHEDATNAQGEVEKTEMKPGIYAIMEQTPPDGYQRTANPAVIRLDQDGNKTMMATADGAASLQKEGTVEFLRWRETTTTVDIDKVDENGAPVKGAELAIFDQDGKIVETWTSDESAHRIAAKLVAGKTYTLKELKAPEGYEKADDQTFTVEAEDIAGIKAHVQSVSMTDKITPNKPTQPDQPNKPDKPTTPGKPTQPNAPKDTQVKSSGTKTGDPTRAALPAAAGATALAGLLIILAQKKRHNQ